MSKVNKPYKRMAFPWISKSKLKTMEYCPYLYYKQYIVGEPSTKRRDAIEGTNMHMVFAKFFGGLKYDDVSPYFEVDNQVPVSRQPFRRFVYERCMEYVKETQRKYGKYKLILSNFATLETQRWIELCDVLSNKSDIYKYFKPLFIEQRMENESTKLFGTVDRVDIKIMPDKTRKIVIIDYKTGNVPKSIQRGRDPMKPYSWTLPTNFMKEMHFYALLYILEAGWKLPNEMLEFLNDEEWWILRDNVARTYALMKKKKQVYLTELNTNKTYRPFQPGKILKGGDIIIAMYFLGGREPYRVEKEFSYRTYKAVLMSINLLRSKIHNEEFVTDPAYCFEPDICDIKNCSNLESCKGEVGIEDINEVEYDS